MFVNNTYGVVLMRPTCVRDIVEIQILKSQQLVMGLSNKQHKKRQKLHKAADTFIFLGAAGMLHMLGMLVF